jgi:hypothetical protein
MKIEGSFLFWGKGLFFSAGRVWNSKKVRNWCIFKTGLQETQKKVFPILSTQLWFRSRKAKSAA